MRIFATAHKILFIEKYSTANYLLNNLSKPIKSTVNEDIRNNKHQRALNKSMHFIRELYFYCILSPLRT